MSRGLAPNPYSRFRHHTIDEEALDAADFFDLPFNPGVQLRGYSAFNEPNCQVIFEDFMPGHEIWWTVPHDEVQYCISGEAEFEVFMPPLYEESVKATLKAGSVCSLPTGARFNVKVIGDQPFRHLAICPPIPGYNYPTYEDIKQGGT